VALVRISDAGLKRAARKKGAKNRHLGTIAYQLRVADSIASDSCLMLDYMCAL